MTLSVVEDITIYKQPGVQISAPGATGIWSVGATGPDIIYYQWYVAGYTGAQETGITGYTGIVGATGPQLIVENVELGDNRKRFICECSGYPIN